MIKRIIFDLDNTLIIWKKEYLNALKETVEDYNLDVDYIDIDNLIEHYEESCHCYSKDMMLDMINKKFDLNLKTSFIDDWSRRLGNMADVDDYVIETLEYLSKKYELVVLTNWFKEVQITRLKTANIYKYFKEIYGGEEYLKPSPNSFLSAIGDKKVSECIMIGDSLEIDIEGALNIGMKAILVDRVNVYPESSNYQKIKTIESLKELL